VDAVGGRALRAATARAPGEREVAEVREQLAAVLAGDRLGMELHPPQRLLAVADAHDDAVLRPRRHLERVRHVGDRERVVADRREGRRDAVEEVGAGVMDGRDAPVHRLGRVCDLAAEQVADPLVAEADAEHGEVALADRAGADAEVRGPLGPAGTGRDDDRVEALEVDLRPVAVVGDDDRRAPVHLAQQLVEVVGERVVVVDQQRAHVRPPPRR
jgi:hypothetical protein